MIDFSKHEEMTSLSELSALNQQLKKFFQRQMTFTAKKRVVIKIEDEESDASLEESEKSKHRDRDLVKIQNETAKS